MKRLIYVIAFTALLAFQYYAVAQFRVDSGSLYSSKGEIVSKVVEMGKYRGSAMDTVNIGIGLILDRETRISKSFATLEILKANPISNERSTLIPKFVDFVYGSEYAIDGEFRDGKVDLRLYKFGKKIANINCANDWMEILNNLVKELEKADGYKLTSKFKSINEGKKQSIYEKEIAKNLPSKLKIETPLNKEVNLSSLRANLSEYNSKKPYEEIMAIYGGFSSADINDIYFFKSKDVPENAKATVKPLVYPLANTTTYSFKYLSYGGVLKEQKDNDAALNCFFTSLNTTDKAVLSSKHRSFLKATAFDKISQIYNNSNSRSELGKLYSLAAKMNFAYTNSETASKENDAFSHTISEIEQIAQTSEKNAARVKKARTAMMVGSILGGLAPALGSMGTVPVIDMGVFNTISTIGINRAEKSQVFLENLARTPIAVPTEVLGLDGLDFQHANLYVSNELFSFLTSHPNEIRDVLVEFSNDKPKLKSLVQSFYSAADSDKPKIAQDVYAQMAMIEAVTCALEVRGKLLDGKTKEIF